MEQYKDFAFVYDELMNEVDYNGWVKYIEDIIKNENAQVQNILELACGTGNLTIPLTKKNYDNKSLGVLQLELFEETTASVSEIMESVGTFSTTVPEKFSPKKTDIVAGEFPTGYRRVA